MIDPLTKIKSIEPSQKAIIFFDDDCLLCNKTVLFLLKRDIHKTLQFAPIGGDTFKALNLETNPANKNTVIFFKNGEISLRSTAILKTLSLLSLNQLETFSTGMLLKIELSSLVKITCVLQMNLLTPTQYSNEVLFRHDAHHHINHIFDIRLREIVAITSVCRPVRLCTKNSGSSIKPTIATLALKYFCKHK